MPHQFVPFVGLVVIIILIPGPDMTLTIRNGLSGGRSLAFWTGIGACFGLTLWGALSAAGLAALVAASDTAYNAVRYTGVAYLVWMGAAALWHARHAPAAPEPTTQPTADAPADATAQPAARERFGGPARTTRAAITQGFLSNSLNPKIAVFFLTLIPQFIDKGEPKTRVTVIMSATFVALSIVFYRVLSIAVAKFAAVLVTGHARLWIERIAGCALIGLGLQVALTS